MVNKITDGSYRLRIGNAFLYVQRSDSTEVKKWLKIGPLRKCTSYASACTSSQAFRDSVFDVVNDGNRFLLKQENLYVTALTENGTFFHMANNRDAAARFSILDGSLRYRLLYSEGKVAKGANNLAEVLTGAGNEGKLHLIPWNDLPEGTYTVKIAGGGVFHGHNGTQKWQPN